MRGQIKIESMLPPAISVFGSRTIVVPTWTEVPEGTTLADITWVRPAVKVFRPVKHNVGKYVVTVFGPGKKHCTCLGFMYRKKCKHSNSF